MNVSISVTKLVTETPKHENIKTALCEERRKALGTNQNYSLSADIISFNEDFLKLTTGTHFLKFDCRPTGNNEKR